MRLYLDKAVTVDYYRSLSSDVSNAIDDEYLQAKKWRFSLEHGCRDERKPEHGQSLCDRVRKVLERK